MSTSQIYSCVNCSTASVQVGRISSSPVRRVLVGMQSRLLLEGSHQWWVFPQTREKLLRRYYFLFTPSPKKVRLELQKIYCSFMQSTSSVIGIALVLKSKSVLDLLPLYVDLHLSSMIFLKYFMVLFFTVTKHMVFIMLLLMAMHSTM